MVRAGVLVRVLASSLKGSMLTEEPTGRMVVNSTDSLSPHQSEMRGNSVL